MLSEDVVLAKASATVVARRERLHRSAWVCHPTIIVPEQIIAFFYEFEPAVPK